MNLTDNADIRIISISLIFALKVLRKSWNCRKTKRKFLGSRPLRQISHLKLCYRYSRPVSHGQILRVPLKDNLQETWYKAEINCNQFKNLLIKFLQKISEWKSGRSESLSKISYLPLQKIILESYSSLFSKGFPCSILF